MTLDSVCPEPTAWRITLIAAERDRLVFHVEPLRRTVACPVWAPRVGACIAAPAAHPGICRGAAARCPSSGMLVASLAMFRRAPCRLCVDSLEGGAL
jgi:hypothetical protein